MFAELRVSGDRARAGQGLDFPKLRAAAVVLRISAESVDEQPLFAVGSQARVRDEGDAQLGLAAEQLHDTNG